MACAGSTERVGVLDPDHPYRLNPNVALRDEPFGALAYDFVTRRLSFLKTPELVAIVRDLENQPHVHAALDDSEIPEGQREQYLRALAGLAEAGTINPR